MSETRCADCWAGPGEPHLSTCRQWVPQATARSFQTKDSGERIVHASGMQRDTTAGKVDYMLLRDGPMFERWAALLQRGAEKYDKRNWMKANSFGEHDRAVESAARHFEQWLRGDEDEDHAAAVFFNINEVEYLREQLATELAKDEEKA